MSLRLLPWIALGGAMGAVMRYLISGLLFQILGRGFPWGTLAVNLIAVFWWGCWGH